MGERMRILVAEDNAIQAEALRALLELEGFEVEVAPDGQAAFERALSSAFAIIISDANMPRLTGWELYRALRADARTRNIPFVLVSGSDDDGTRARTAQAGITKWLRKPLDVERLLAIVRDP